MARDSADMKVERIPSIINDILLENSLSRDGHSSVHGFDNIVQGFSRKNCSDMPLLMLTEEDRQELQRDRENAMKCEEILARRKQEQYFDLVDKVQNVLRRIEKKNSQKSNNSQSKEIYNSTSTKSPSDCNNNPSPKHSETYIENMESFTSPKHVQRNNTNSDFGESLNWEKSRQLTGRRNNTGRYSLPANFETMYQTFPSAGDVKNNGGIVVGEHHTYSHMQRPLSAYSNHDMVHGNRGYRSHGNQNGAGDSGDDHGPVTNYHMYSQHQRPLSVMSDNQQLHGDTNGHLSDFGHHQLSSNHQSPLSVMSDNQHLYAGTNGRHSRPGPETLHQPWNQKPFPAHTDYHPSYTNTSENMDKHIRQAEMPPNATNSALKTSHSNTMTNSTLGHSNTMNHHSSTIDNSPISQTSESHSTISKQREFLALEQKRLEDHYAALRGQLLDDFQQQQQELIQVYNKSLETQSGADQTMQSILERSFESDSDGTLVSSTTDQENFTLLRTEELPQSPFGINVKKTSTSFQNTDVGQKKGARSLQNSAERRKQGPNAFQNSGSPNGRPKSKNNVRLFQNNTSPISSLKKSTSPSKERLMKKSSSFQNSVPQDQRFTKGSTASQNSAPQDQRFKNIPTNSSQHLASPDVGLARNSFNSEVSAQEYYEMPNFGEKTEVTGKSKIGNKLERDVCMGSGRDGVVGKAGRNSTKSFGVVTSPKRTQLSSFESQAVKNPRNTQSHKFSVVSAHAKGFLTRLLFQTAKINELITTVKDAKSVLAEMSTESSQSITDRSFKERVKAQLHSAQSELRRIFVDSPPYVRMQILEHNRKLLQEKDARNANKVYSSGGSSPRRPKLSNVTMKKRLSRQENQERTPKSEKAGTPNSSKTSRSATRERNTPKSVTKNAPTTTTAKTTPKSKSKNEVSPVSDTVDLDMVKATCPGGGGGGAVTVQTTSITATTSAITKTIAATTAPVTTAVTTTRSKKTVEKKQDVTRVARNKPSVKSSKASTKVTQASKNRRRTWDTSVLKPIQGRISPTIPSEKTRSSNEKRQSTLSTARKVGQKLLSDYQTNGLSGQSNTCEVSGIDMSKTYKVNNKQEQPVKKTGARRSLAANLSHK